MTKVTLGTAMTVVIVVTDVTVVIVLPEEQKDTWTKKVSWCENEGSIDNCDRSGFSDSSELQCLECLLVKY